MVNDEELDKFISDNLDKKIEQTDKISENVDSQIGEMGWLFDRSREKIEADKTCFNCKRTVDLKKEKLQLVEATNSEKGTFIIVSLCENCFSKLREEQEKKVEDKKNVK